MEKENTCVRCGKPCPEGDVMCPACSEWLEDQDKEQSASAGEPEKTKQEPEKTEKRCIHCGGTIPAEAEFCSLCGKDLLAVTEDDEEEEDMYEEKERRFPWLIVCLSAAVVLLLAALVFMVVMVIQSTPELPKNDESQLGVFEPAEGITLPSEEPEEEPLPEPEPEPEAVACRNCGVAITVEDAVCPFCEWDQALDPADFVEVPLEAALGTEEDLAAYGVLTVTSTSETSALVQTGRYDNSAAATIDGNINSSWQDGVAGDGIGESVNYEFENEVYVKGLALWLGNWREGSDWWEQNNVPKLVNIYIGDTVLTLEFPYEKECQYVVFNQLVPTQLIMLEISSVYDGYVYEDTCIAEVQIIGSTEAE